MPPKRDGKPKFKEKINQYVMINDEDNIEMEKGYN